MCREEALIHDVSLNLQDGRTLLTCPFLASWTAFVCACNGGRTRQASKRRPRAAEVMARFRHHLGILEVRCLPLTHFQVSEPNDLADITLIVN